MIRMRQSTTSGEYVPTKRRQNIPGKTPRPSRNSHNRSAGVRGGSTRGAHSAYKAAPHGFSTSAPQSKSTFRPSAKTKSVGGFSNASSHGFGPAFNQVASGVSAKKTTPQVLLTRRNLLIGAGAIAGVAALGGGISFAANSLGGSKEVAVDTISVPEDAVNALSDYNQVDYTQHVKIAGSYKLTYGTLVWADNDTVAACLVPGESASPLNTVSLLYLSSGKTASVLSAAQGAGDGYEIVDVRCSESGLIWTESSAYESSWRVYTAKLSNGSATAITQVDQGDGNWLMPSLAAVGETAFWQVCPNTSGDAASERSALKSARFGSSDVAMPYTSKKAFATRVTPADDGVVITPRAEATGTYYQLTKISAKDNSTVDQMTLPSSMTPDLASYGRSGFSFGFSSIYNFGGGIANLGTYTPRSAANPYQYNNLQWFRFTRTPITSPCWSGEWFIVKSTTALCGVNFGSKSYFAIDTASGCDTYGEHLVSTGTRSSFVGLSQITDDNDSKNDHALVRVFSPIKGSIESAF